LLEQDLSKMSSNYPPGVTGNEYQIAGADHEFSDEREVSCDNEECSEYENYFEAGVDVEMVGDTEYWTWNCPSCGSSRDYDREVEWEDPDRLHDEMGED